MPSLLTAHNLVKVFPEVRAVDDVSFEVEQGTCFGLLGPNGAGKTTTLEMLEGIQDCTSGTIHYKERPLDAGYREEVGIQFQATALQDFQTVAETLEMFTRLYSRTGDRDELVRLCNLDGILHQDTRTLSGGQRQRLLLAIALVNDPELVFLDEPTTGLDPQSRRNFWGLIETVQKRGKTVVLTTHYMEEAQHLCDRVAIIDHGKVIAEGRPQGLIRAHFPDVVVRLPEEHWPREQVLPPSAVVRDGHVEVFTHDVAAVLDLLRRADADLTEMRVETPNLEDLFLKLTGHALRA